MARVTIPVPNMINGISQQPQTIRLPSQGELQNNAWSSLVDGLGKRVPTEYVGQVSTSKFTDNGTAFVHTVDRDAGERFVVVIFDDGVEETLKVFDLTDGTEKTVLFPDGKAYLVSSDPRKDLKAITIADFTFIVNSTIETKMDTTKSTDRRPEALISARTAPIPDGQYTIFIAIPSAPSAFTSFTYDSIPANKQTSEKVIDALFSDLADATTGLNGSTPPFAAPYDTGWTLTRRKNNLGSAIYITRADGLDFLIQSSDGQGDLNLIVNKERAQSITDLPIYAPAGFVIKIIGDADVAGDDYYVKFVPVNEDTVDQDFDKGVWEETIAPDIQFKFDLATMPHVLVRETSGDFTFRKGTWEDRLIGDEDTNPDPSFVGQKIKGVTLFRNRLAFHADDNIILSEAGEFFNFWRKTVVTLLDSAPIDLNMAHDRVSFLRYAIPFREEMILFSDKTEFIFGAPQTNLLTPRTASQSVLAEYETLANVRPISSGRSLYFAIDRDKFSGIREFTAFSDNESSADAPEITAHIPKLLLGNAVRLAGSTNANILVVLTDNDPNTLYIYKYFWNGDQKVQSSWSRWTFGADILGMDFIENELILVVEDANGAHLEKLIIADGREDTGVNYLNTIDRRQDETEVVSVTYAAGPDETTITTLWRPTANVQVVDQVTGSAFAIKSVSGNDIVITGDLTADSLFIGEKYEFRYRFSDQYQRQGTQIGGLESIIAGRTQLRKGRVSFERSAFFKIETTPDLRPLRIDTFEGDTFSAVNIQSGIFTFGVQFKNDGGIIDLVNDSHLPSFFMTAEFDAEIVTQFVKR